MAVAEEWANSNLNSFKQRMRISTDDPNEMSNLTDMLVSSYTSIIRLVGVSDASDPEVKELIFERSRYTYNDALDEFLKNYREAINNAFLANQPKDDEDEDSL